MSRGVSLSAFDEPCTIPSNFGDAGVDAELLERRLCEMLGISWLIVGLSSGSRFRRVSSQLVTYRTQLLATDSTAPKARWLREEVRPKLVGMAAMVVPEIGHPFAEPRLPRAVPQLLEVLPIARIE